MACNLSIILIEYRPTAICDLWNQFDFLAIINYITVDCAMCLAAIPPAPTNVLILLIEWLT